MSRGSRDPVSLGDATCDYATPKAIRVDLESGEIEVWIPRSVVHDDSEVYDEEQEGELIVFEWWAKKEGLI